MFVLGPAVSRGRGGEIERRGQSEPETAVSRGRPLFALRMRGQDVVLGRRTWIMGVLNVTPDSFSDGGRFDSADAAVAHGLALLEAGADILDVGGESTRPGGATRVDAAEECSRVVPVVRALRQHGASFLSIDTTKADVAREALDAGADLVNDVSGFRFDPALAQLVAERDVPAVLMHLRGDFGAMHRAPRYRDVMGEIVDELKLALARAADAGVTRERVIVDPGIGFAKDASHSLEALARLPELQALGCPVLVGPSRKSFLGKVLDLPVGERLFGTAAAVAVAVLGGAHLVRVHDVREMVQVARVCDAVLATAPIGGEHAEDGERTADRAGIPGETVRGRR